MDGYYFTEHVRTALAVAREEASRLGHEYVGTEHMLLGLLRAGDGVAVTMLGNLNVPLDEVGNRIESIVHRGHGGPTRPPDLPYTSRAKKVLELAMSEARAANHSYVGTEHLLLGMLVEGKGITAQVLTSFGVTIDNLRGEMHHILGTGPVDHSRLGRPRGSSRASPDMNRSSGALSRVPNRVENVIVEARKVAMRAGAARLAALHLALGLLAHREGIAIAAIERMGGDVSRLATELEAMMSASASTSMADAIPVAPDYARVMAAAEEEQEAWQVPVMATHHLLIALLETCPDIARPFTAQDITAERVRSEARHIVG